MTLSALITLHAVSTVMMTGLIWFVQLVHYPLLQAVGRQGFRDYEREHVRRTTWVVAPLMLTEAFTAVAIFFVVPNAAAMTLAGFGWILLAFVWASTAWLQVPCHRQLAEGFDARAASRLVATNWIRTIAWTARSCIAVALPLFV